MQTTTTDLSLREQELVRIVSQKAIDMHKTHVQAQIDVIPKFKLRKEHVKGAELLVDRDELLECMPKGGKVAELGVDEGNFSARILEITNPATLHLVDVWGDARYHEGKALSVQSRFADEIENGQVNITRGLSLEAVDAFEDGYFDWIYIDTDHSYQTTIQELQQWAPKVKANGVIAGHDYTMGNFTSGYKYGVIEAVAEFCTQNNWTLSYLTADFAESNSFAIKRMAN